LEAGVCGGKKKKETIKERNGRIFLRHFSMKRNNVTVTPYEVMFEFFHLQTQENLSFDSGMGKLSEGIMVGVAERLMFSKYLAGSR